VQSRLTTSNGAEEVLVVDPFCGAGSTLIEAQRLGINTLGNDLNPVPALITKALTELLPACQNSGPYFDKGSSALFEEDVFSGFRRDAMYWISEIKRRVEPRLEQLYGQQSERGRPYAWLWAHVTECPNPACRLPVPLFASSTLSAQPGREFFLTLDISSDRCVFGVTSKHADATAPTKIAGRRAEFRCPRCGQEFDEEHVRQAGTSGNLTEQLMSVAWVGPTGSRWFEAPGRDSAAGIPDKYPDIDDIDLPGEALGFRVQAYGFPTYLSLYTPRQAEALSTYAREVAALRSELLESEVPRKYALAVLAFLGLCVGRQSRFLSKQATWRTRKGPSKVEAGFSQQIVTMVWDFAEANPLAGSVGDWGQVGTTALRSLDSIPIRGGRGTVTLGDAETVASRISASSRILVATDPPYFDAIGYADLADYFYLWHREALRDVFPDLYTTMRSPRISELIADRARHDGSEQQATQFFIQKFQAVFKNLLELSANDLPMILIYAHQQKEGAYGNYGSTGWEAMLQALIEAQVVITASWPMHATSATRSRGLSSNALASYIVLVCRARPSAAGTSTRRAFISELRLRLPEALRTLQQGSIAPVDLAQAAIGPGMAVFSSYAKIVEPDGSPMRVRTALGLINQILDEVLADQEGDFDPETRFCLKWFTQFGWEEQLYGRADELARSTNTSVDSLTRGGVFWARAGKARLLEPLELEENWDPATDDRISVWEVVLRLGRALSAQGAEEAARLMAAAGQRVDLDVAKELAYLLFSICEKRGWTQTALLFNGLGTSWSDLSAAARTDGPLTPPPVQGELDFSNGEE
jgi:putative DNA methylase